MAMIETWFTCNLLGPVQTQVIKSGLFSQDSLGNLIGVEVYSDGEPVTLSGSVTGYIVLSDGTTVPVAGSRSTNKAWIVMPPSAYTVPGEIKIAIKLTDGSSITTLAACKGYMEESRTGTQVDPGQTVTDWTNQISAALQDVDDAIDDMAELIAVPYENITFPVVVGTWTTNAGKLYKCKTQIDASEAFTASHWTQTKVSDEVSNLKSAVTEFNCCDLLKDFCAYNYRTTGGVTYTWDAAKRVCTVNGGPAGSTNYDVMYSDTQNIPSQIIPGETYFLNVSTTFASLALRIYIYHSDGTNEYTNYTGNSLLTIPADIRGMIVRIQLANGKTANNDKISVSLTKAKSNKQLTDEEAFTGTIMASDGYNSIDNIDKFGIYFISSESNITDFPFPSGWLMVNPTKIGATTNTMQIAIRWNTAASGNNAVYRTKNNATWRDWATLQDEEPVRRALDEIHRFNCFDLANYSNGSSGTVSGITYTKNDDNSWTIDGSTTSENYSFRNILQYDTALPEFIVPGRKYHITISPDSIAYIQIYTYFGDGTHTSENLPRDYEFTIPENATGIILRFRVDRNKTIDNQRVDVKILAVPVLGGEGGDTYIINQEIHNDTFENQYSISVEPQFTTDTNGWLQPVDTESEDETGKTDMTSAIMAMLTQTGYCHLAPGVFYVSGNIDMPDGSMLEGCGKKTVIRLLQSVTEGYAVKMEKYNSISNLRISGSYIDIPYSSFTADKGTRHGIIFNSRYAEGTRQTEHCTVQNIYLDNFTGCGIKCYNTSISTARGIYASQIKIARCQTGIFVDFYSEFNKFELVNTRYCYIACENDGGNNMFIGCTFAATNTGFLIDNSLDDKANNAHGGVVGCTFCHIGGNQGIAIAVKNIANGFTFSDCQVWYCSLLIEDSYGVAFTGMEFGRGTTGGGATIRINRGGSVIFTGCMFMNDVRYAPDIVITDNDKVHFTGCYGSHSGNAISAVES